jgi:hypothetical protein
MNPMTGETTSTVSVGTSGEFRKMCIIPTRDKDALYMTMGDA